MICINRPETDPYFNIAAEEYILKNYTEDVMMLWQSEPSVVIGKHQNTFNEINHNLIEEKNIPVVRRISGGGTVYHDLHNLNYSLIRTGKRKDRLIDFREFLKPVIIFLSTLGIEAVFKGKNNLFIEDSKISGNAAHVYKQRVLHHGTLLFDSDITALQIVIHPPDLMVMDKAVQSVRSDVTNIARHLKREMTIESFKSLLQEYLMSHHKITEVSNLSKSDQQAINTLVKEKYGTWHWNYGYSPVYSFNNKSIGEQVNIEVKNGLIVKATFQSDYAREIDLAGKINGLPHRKTEIIQLLNEQLEEQNKIAAYAALLGF